MADSTGETMNNLSLISDLNPGKDMWNMKARIIRKWHQSYRLDLILLDEKGFKIQAGIKDPMMTVFEPQLKEDDVVILSKFGVGENQDKYKVVDHVYKINFYRCTTVQHVHGWQGVEYGFKFIPFHEIRNGAANDLLSVDVCGMVIDCKPLGIYGKPPNETKRLIFELQDLEGNMLTVTLWNEYAQEFSNFISNNSQTEHVMAIIQHGKVRVWKDERQVQSDRFATRVFLNQEINETNELRRRLLLNLGQAGASSSQIVLSSQTVYPLRQEFVNDGQRKHVDEIIELRMETTCVVVATIKIVQEKYGWFYPGCRKCHKKVLSKSEYLEKYVDVSEEIMKLPTSALICPKCKCECQSITPKFKVQLRVQDDTGSVSFVLFDSHVSRLIGISATEIRERQVTNGDTETFPHEMSRLINKKCAFKIEVTDYNLKNIEYNVYTVLKICDDPEIICELLGSDENAEEVSQGVADLRDVILSESSQDVDKGISKDVVSVTADSSVVTLENDCDESPNGKRVVEDDNIVNVGELSSTTKRSRRKQSKF